MENQPAAYAFFPAALLFSVIVYRISEPLDGSHITHPGGDSMAKSHFDSHDPPGERLGMVMRHRGGTGATIYPSGAAERFARSTWSEGMTVICLTRISAKGGNACLSPVRIAEPSGAESAMIVSPSRSQCQQEGSVRVLLTACCIAFA